MRVRELRSDEVARALVLTGAEGWTFERPELERLLRLGPALVLDDGELRGMLDLTFHGDVAWIGNVVVQASLRGRGLGAKLLDAALAAADARGVRTVALYAVPKAIPLYERAGFVADGRLVALSATAPRAVASAETRPMTPLDLRDVLALDRAALGFDREALLRELLAAYADTAWVVRRSDALVGYAFGKPGWASHEVGPLVGDTEAQAALLDTAVATLAEGSHGPVELALPEANAAALAHARDLGFAETFRPVIMFRGPAPSTRWERVGAVGGLEKG